MAHLAGVHTIYEKNMRDMPAMLRRLADRIESGEVEARQITCAVECPSDVLIFGWGNSTALESIGLLTVAMNRLAGCVLVRNED